MCFFINVVLESSVWAGLTNSLRGQVKLSELQGNFGCWWRKSSGRYRVDQNKQTEGKIVQNISIFFRCVKMVDMRMDAIMIENMILTMLMYFILEKIGR